MGAMSNSPGQASGKGGNAPASGPSALPSGSAQSNQQPQFGMPNRYANSVGTSSWDNASLYSRAPIGGGKGGKVQPSGVGYPSQTSGKTGPMQSVIQKAQPQIQSPIANIPGAKYSADMQKASDLSYSKPQDNPDKSKTADDYYLGIP